MTSLRGDVVNRVKRLPKPSQASEALQPVFEAVSNALHAIEALFTSEYQSRGRIDVSFTNLKDANQVEIEVSDNGIGLNHNRYAAFCTTDTDYNISVGGKGIGRLLWLDAFSKINVESIFHENDRKFLRKFEFILRTDEQIANEYLEDITGSERHTGTRILFKGLRHQAYASKFPIQPATITKHFGSHFFADFILGKSPQIFLFIEEDLSVFPGQIQDLRIEDRGVAQIDSSEFGQLSLASFICHKTASANFDGTHQMHLVANGRTVTTRKIDGLLGIGRFGPEDDQVYHGCISGEFLDDRVNQERTQFNFDESIVDNIVKECAEHARTHAIPDHISKFEEHRLEIMERFISEYPSFGFEDTKDLLARTPKNAVKPEQFAQALIPLRIRRDKARQEAVQQIVSQLGNQQEVPADIADAVRKAADDIRAEEQRQLTEYVMRRKVVLDVLEVLLRRVRERREGETDFHLESTLHQFICPMKIRGDDPSKIEDADHDLWIVDERLTFTRFFASDVPFTQIIADETGTTRPDLLIFDRIHGLGTRGEEPLRRVMLVEFKQPGRKEYTERYSPLNQISEYITRLKGGEVEDFRNGRVRIADDCIFYCYVVADIVGKLDTHTSSWRTTSNGRGRIYELSGKFRGMIEIIEWADLLNDARLRNHAFIHAASLQYGR